MLNNYYATATAADAVISVDYGRKTSKVTRIECSYKGTSPTGSLTITDKNSKVVWSVDITDNSPHQFRFPHDPIEVEGEITITLSNGGGSVVGKLNVFVR